MFYVILFDPNEVLLVQDEKKAGKKCFLGVKCSKVR